MAVGIGPRARPARLFTDQHLQREGHAHRVDEGRLAVGHGIGAQRAVQLPDHRRRERLPVAHPDGDGILPGQPGRDGSVRRQ